MTRQNGDKKPGGGQNGESPQKGKRGWVQWFIGETIGFLGSKGKQKKCCE